MKKKRLFLFLVCLVGFCFAPNVMADTQLLFKINGDAVFLEGATMKEGRIYLVADSFPRLDSSIEVVNGDGQVVLKNGAVTLVFAPDADSFERHEEAVEIISCSPVLPAENGALYLPLADAARALGYYVKWEQGVVHIYTEEAKIEHMKGLQFPMENAFFAYMPDSQDTVFSPIGMKYALAMLANGVDEESRDEILTLMGHESLEAMNSYLQEVQEKANNFKTVSGYMRSNTHGYVQVDNAKIGTQLNISNSLWLEKAAFAPEEAVLNPAYEKTIQEYLDGEIYILETSEEYGNIDQWAQQKTNGMIESANIKPGFYALLMNAVYFEAPWKDTFSVLHTAEEEFTQKDGGKISMDFMSGEFPLVQNSTILKNGTRVKWYNYIENDWAQIYSKLYEEDHISMIFVLPKDENWNTVNVNNVLQSLYLNSGEDISYEDYVTLVRFKVPKFSTYYDGEENFEEILASVGVNKIFATTDYSNMLQEGTLDYDFWSINQQARLLIDEDGTKAAALTAIAPGGSSETIKIQYVDMVLDRPFVYLVYDHKHDEILFAGALLYGEQ